MGDPEWLWADPIVLNCNRVAACQWSEARLSVQMKCMRVWWDQANLW